MRGTIVVLLQGLLRAGGALRLRKPSCCSALPLPCLARPCPACPCPCATCSPLAAYTPAGAAAAARGGAGGGAAAADGGLPVEDLAGGCSCLCLPCLARFLLLCCCWDVVDGRRAPAGGRSRAILPPRGCPPGPLRNTRSPWPGLGCPASLACCRPLWPSGAPHHQLMQIFDPRARVETIADNTWHLRVRAGCRQAVAAPCTRVWHSGREGAPLPALPALRTVPPALVKPAAAKWGCRRTNRTHRPNPPQVEVVPEEQRDLEQSGVLHAHCLQVTEEPNSVSETVSLSVWPPGMRDAGKGAGGCISGGCRDWNGRCAALCQAGAPPAAAHLPTSSPSPLPPQRPFAFSDPFVMRLEPEETVGQLRQRVQVRRAGCASPRLGLAGSCNSSLH